VKTIESISKVPAFVNERPRVHVAIVTGVALVLLFAMLAPTLASARAEDNAVHVTGTYIPVAVTPFVATYTVTHGSTTTAVSDSNVVSDITETGSSGHGELVGLLVSARDTGSNIRFVTAIATYSGTIGNSQPGIFSETLTYTFDYSNPSRIVVSGTSTVIHGSGQGGLKGICGGTTFQATVTSPPSPGTFDSTYHFGASCASNSQGD